MSWPSGRRLRSRRSCSRCPMDDARCLVPTPHTLYPIPYAPHPPCCSCKLLQGSVLLPWPSLSCASCVSCGYPCCCRCRGCCWQPATGHWPLETAVSPAPAMVTPRLLLGGGVKVLDQTKAMNTQPGSNRIPIGQLMCKPSPGPKERENAPVNNRNIGSALLHSPDARRASQRPRAPARALLSARTPLPPPNGSVYRPHPQPHPPASRRPTMPSVPSPAVHLRESAGIAVAASPRLPLSLSPLLLVCCFSVSIRVDPWLMLLLPLLCIPASPCHRVSASSPLPGACRATGMSWPSGRRLRSSRSCSRSPMDAARCTLKDTGLRADGYAQARRRGKSA